YKTVIQMIQNNQLMDFNYVWAEHLDKWTPVYLLEEFSKDRFQLLQNDPEYKAVFTKRKDPRIDIKIPVIGHNTIRFFDGEIVSISASGALCLLNTPLVQVGDNVKLHIKINHNSELAFNVECTVARKNHSRQRLNSKSGLYYAVKFNEIQDVGIEQITKWVTTATAA
ncbi:MAG: PilZ domain-containing protein, partial [Bdellovibrionales bacterium]